MTMRIGLEMDRDKLRLFQEQKQLLVEIMERWEQEKKRCREVQLLEGLIATLDRIEDDLWDAYQDVREGIEFERGELDSYIDSINRRLEIRRTALRDAP
jgi:hypothetical protein